MTRESRTVDRPHQVASPTQRHLPLVDLLVDTRAELMELAVTSGLKVLTTMLEDDRRDLRSAVCASGGASGLARRHSAQRGRPRGPEGGDSPATGPP
jgi:hypothetical protein